MRQLINDNWEFKLLDVDTQDGYDNVSGGSFLAVTIPHDWLIYDTSDMYRDGLGVYRKNIDINEDPNGRYFIIFDGVYMDSVYYMNGVRIGEWKYGYSQYVLDVTDSIRRGTNELLVTVRHRSPNTRWYSGAGIYRDVWFKHTGSTYIPENGIYFHAKPEKGHPDSEDPADKGIGQNTDDADGYIMKVDVEICRSSDLQEPSAKTVPDDFKLDIWLEPADTSVSGKERYRFTPGDMYPSGQADYTEKPEHEGSRDEDLLTKPVVRTDINGNKLYIYSFICHIDDPHLWDINDPFLYKITVNLSGEGASQTEEFNVGLRDIVMDPDRGFFLNGRNIKLNGVCEHHDLGILGAEFNKSAMRRKFEILKTMGVNAVRGTHNMMAPGLLELADEMGLLYVSEAFDMWEHPKTEYDYARFFDEWHERDVASWVRRDRNHPCVILWSIGNEISDIHSDAVRGCEITGRLKELVESHDPLHNGYVTHGSNYMPWENAQKSADILKVVGYNYGEKCYKEHHKVHPDWVIFGSETSSIVQSRGVYHFPLGTNVLGEDDLQCSALGNSPSSWSAKSYEICAGLDRDMEFSMGQFLWSGFDYIGEPTPYHTRSSYFGQIDTAGFPKDSYYFWKSVWTDPKTDPFVHIFPYWDFNEGQIIDVRVVSNLDEVELFLNGESLGRQSLDHKSHSGFHLIADYSVRYTPGELSACAYKSGGSEPVAECVQKSFKDTASLAVTRYDPGNFEDKSRTGDIAPDKFMNKDRDRLVFFEISALDEDGNPVMNACDMVLVKAVNGELIGLDNGDSSDPDGYRVDMKRLFNGKLLAIVRPFTGCMESVRIEAVIADQTPDVRRITLTCDDDRILTPDNMTVRVKALIYPPEARSHKIAFRAVDDSGVDSRLVTLETGNVEVYITAKGDGRFKLRATSGNDLQPVRVISELDFEVSGIGCAYFDPYGFISGSSYSSCIGEVSNGNEKGFATARDDKTIVTFSDIDFGRIGTKKITVPVFCLDSDEVPMKIWEGIPGEEGAELIVDDLYSQKRIWNVYIEQSFNLRKRLTGKSVISFEFEHKVHIKGFSFEQDDICDVLFNAADADSIYGDTFVKNEDSVTGIGNNVSLEFNGLDMGKQGINGIRISGRTPNSSNPVHVRFTRGDEEIREVCEFERSAEYTVCEYKLPDLSGVWNLSFVFLPGSVFDLKSFSFKRF